MSYLILFVIIFAAGLLIFRARTCGGPSPAVLQRPDCDLWMRKSTAAMRAVGTTVPWFGLAASASLLAA